MLRFYNSLTRKEELFSPLHTPNVTMYNCGPTVYHYAHLGNFRSYVFADLLRRFLEYKGYKVKQVMNITDVGHMTSDFDHGDDKMEVAARREKKSPAQIADFYERAFFEDIERLNIRQAWKYPRATKHIPEMIALVEKLVEKGYAYVSNRSVYYDVTTFGNYGDLSGNTLTQLRAGARIEVNPDKRNPWDFALWIHDPRHRIYWQSPWNDHGYPGWHLECSVMSMKYLGETLDIHTGGEDNKFPHHECEIAQSEAATGNKFVRYWLHVKHLIVEGRKMSKSKGNFYTLRDLLSGGKNPRAIRYLLLSTHYRQQSNFTSDGIEAAQNAIDRLDQFMAAMRSCRSASGAIHNQVSNFIVETRRRFEDALDDDLNISQGLAAIHNFITEINKITVNRTEASEVANLILELDQVLGLGLEKPTEKIALPEGIEELIQEREDARRVEDFAKADQIRQELAEKGILLEDTSEGPRVKLTE